MRYKEKDNAKWKKAYHVFDEDGNEFISVASLRHVTTILGKSLPMFSEVMFRGGVLEDVLDLEDTFSSPWPWPRSLKSLALTLASKP